MKKQNPKYKDELNAQTKPIKICGYCGRTELAIIKCDHYLCFEQGKSEGRKEAIKEVLEILKNSRCLTCNSIICDINNKFLDGKVLENKIQELDTK